MSDRPTVYVCGDCPWVTTDMGEWVEHQNRHAIDTEAEADDPGDVP